MNNKSNFLRMPYLVTMTILFAACDSGQIMNPNPERDGYVSHPETAIKIAEAVWRPIYGDEIDESKPFKADLQDSVWVVSGTLHAKLGGTPKMVITKKEGRILLVEHQL